MAKPLKYHVNPAPHRRLFRTARGEDVKAFERGLNARLAKMPPHLADGLDPVKVDGVFDTADFELWKAVRYAIGLPAGHAPTIAAQLNVRRPSTRTPAAKRRAKKRRSGTAKPKIVTAAQLGLGFQWLWGGKGGVQRGTGHYDAGPVCETEGELIARARSIHAYHSSIGWGGASYEALISGRTIVLLNPVGRKSAAVAGMNTGTTNICVPGTTGDRMDPVTAETVRWYLENAHTRAIPAAHRLPWPAKSVTWRGHKEWPGQSTSCPGDYLPTYKELFR